LSLLFVPTANADHWADEPLNKPPIPTVGGQNASYPIDAFTLAKLAEKGLRPSPPGPMNPGAEARNFGRKRLVARRLLERMPCSQGLITNPFVFTNWLAGGGIKGGVSYGESDQWSYKPADADKVTYCYAIHARTSRCPGIDHTRLAIRRNGIDRRLTDVHGDVLHEILA